MYAPSELISEEMLPSLENPQPPILYYGWSYSEQWLFEYAKAHKLVHYFTPEYYKATQRAMIEYGKLTDDCEEMQNQESRDFLLGFLDILVRQDLEERCGVNLEMCIPFCDQTKYCGVYALYTNYNAEKRYAEIENVVDIDEVCAEMDEAMNECGNEAKLMWWFDVDNPIVSVCSTCLLGQLTHLPVLFQSLLDTPV